MIWLCAVAHVSTAAQSSGRNFEPAANMWVRDLIMVFMVIVVIWLKISYPQVVIGDFWCEAYPPAQSHMGQNKIASKKKI
jgi:hypothetical protein